MSLAYVKESPPGSSRVAAGASATADDRLDRVAASQHRASRSRAQLDAFEAANADPSTTTSTTAAPPTTSPPTTTAAPTTTKAPVVAAAKVTAATTTTAKPK
ncbi:MAG: hypothetical protein KY458_02505, partial [Actinobacteria bacterium]|nr:hypothetical protein [Actinomycetota bacterium]